MTEPTPQTPAPAAATPAPAAQPTGGQQNAPAQQTPAATPAPARNTVPTSETPPAQQTPNEPPIETPPADGYKIPDAFKDKPWAAKIKSEEDVWKTLDNLQTAVGKKQIVPDFATATPAEITDFQNQLRGSADRAAYVEGLKSPEGVPTGEADMYKQIFFDAAVPPAVAQPLLDKFTGIVETAKKELVSSDGFTKTLTTRFGTDAMAKDGPVAAVANVIAPHMNAADRTIWDNMPNETLGVVYGVIDRILQEHGAMEGASANAGTGSRKGGGSANSAQSIREQMTANDQKIRDLAKNPLHTYAQKKELLDANNDLAVKLHNLENKKRR